MFGSAHKPMPADIRHHRGEEPGFAHSRNILTTETREPKGSFNWNSVYEWDADQLRREHDAEKMHAILNQFVMCKFSQADMDVIKSPLLFRLLGVLQAVLEYMAHSTVELKRMYGQAVLNETNLRNEVGRAREMLRRAKRKITNVMEASKCPTCGAMFESDIELDKHFVKAHVELASLWKGIRENHADTTDEKVARMKKQIDHLRTLLKKEKQLEVVKVPEQKKGREPLPDYYPFKAERDARFAVQPTDDEGTKRCTIQAVENFDMAIGRKSKRNVSIEMKAKRFMDKAKKNEDEMPARIDKLRERVHKEGYLVAMAYNQKMVPRIVRKKVDKRTRPEEEAKPGTIHELFKNLSKPFYYDGPREDEEHEEEEEEKVKEEEETPEPEMEMTSLVYSSMLDSGDNAEYYSHDGGGTTRKQQMRPPIYIDRKKTPKRDVAKDKASQKDKPAQKQITNEKPPKKAAKEEKPKTETDSSSDLKFEITSSSDVPVKEHEGETDEKQQPNAGTQLISLSDVVYTTTSSNVTPGDSGSHSNEGKKVDFRATMPAIPRQNLVQVQRMDSPPAKANQVIAMETTQSGESESISNKLTAKQKSATQSWKAPPGKTAQMQSQRAHQPTKPEHHKKGHAKDDDSASDKPRLPPKAATASSNSFDEPEQKPMIDIFTSSSTAGRKSSKHGHMHSDPPSQRTQDGKYHHKRSMTLTSPLTTTKPSHHRHDRTNKPHAHDHTAKKSTGKGNSQSITLPTPKYDGFEFSEGYSAADGEEDRRERHPKTRGHTGLMTDEELIAMAMKD